jgi:hypothetical protein
MTTAINCWFYEVLFYDVSLSDAFSLLTHISLFPPRLPPLALLCLPPDEATSVGTFTMSRSARSLLILSESLLGPLFFLLLFSIASLVVRLRGESFKKTHNKNLPRESAVSSRKQMLAEQNYFFSQFQITAIIFFPSPLLAVCSATAASNFLFLLKSFEHTSTRVSERKMFEGMPRHVQLNVEQCVRVFYRRLAALCSLPLPELRPKMFQPSNSSLPSYKGSRRFFYRFPSEK